MSENRSLPESSAVPQKEARIAASSPRVILRFGSKVPPGIAYIVGRTSTQAAPNADITRAEVVTILYRLLTQEAKANYGTSAGEGFVAPQHCVSGSGTAQNPVDHDNGFGAGDVLVGTEGADINTFQYTAADVDCKLCTQYGGKKRGCKAEGCPRPISRALVMRLNTSVSVTSRLARSLRVTP